MAALHRSPRARSWQAALATLAACGLALTPEAAPLQRDDESPAVADPAAELPTVGAEARRAADRVLHLASGQRVRGTARLVGERWQIKRGDGWQELNPGQVLRAHDVDTIVLESRRRMKQLDRETELEREQLDGRAAHATWLFEQGLAPEALRLLDDVLDDDPRNAVAHAALEAAAWNMQLPAFDRAAPFREALARWMNEASRTGRAARELALDQIVMLQEHPEFRDAVLAEVAHAVPARRALGLQAWRAFFPGEELILLEYRAILDPDERVRREAALALGDTGEEAVLLPALKALESTSPIVSTHAAEALGWMGQPKAIPALASALAASQSGGSLGHTQRAHITVTNQLAYMQDFDVEIAPGASIADPIVNVVQEGVVLDARVIGVQIYQEVTMRTTIRKALNRLGGQPAPDAEDWDADAWQAWWERNREPRDGASTD